MKNIKLISVIIVLAIISLTIVEFVESKVWIVCIGWIAGIISTTFMWMLTEKK